MALWHDIKKAFSSASNLNRLIYINIAVFLFITAVSIIAYLFNNDALSLKILKMFSVPASLNALALKPWTLITYMFTHKDILHILFNMLGLFMFGSAVERRIGSKEFLLFYLLTGTLSGIFSYFSYYLTGTNVILVGASGAVYAVLFAYAVLYPYARILVFWFFPMRAPVLVALYTAIELFNQVFGVSGGIAHLTHLAGFGFAYLYFIIRLKIKPLDEWRRARRY